MGIFKLGAKLFGTHVIMTLIQFFLFGLLFGIFDNQVYQWVVGIFFIFLFWIIIYADVSHIGQNDLKRGIYNPTKGFLAGLVAIVPDTILYIISLFYSPFIFVLQMWQIPYIKILTSLPDLMPHIAFITVLLFPIGSGLCYMDGPRRRKKILDAIEKSDSLRTEKSKSGR